MASPPLFSRVTAKPLLWGWRGVLFTKVFEERVREQGSPLIFAGGVLGRNDEGRVEQWWVLMSPTPTPSQFPRLKPKPLGIYPTKSPE